jgi:hypothetical protein
MEGVEVRDKVWNIMEYTGIDHSTRCYTFHTRCMGERGRVDR